MISQLAWLFSVSNVSETFEEPGPARVVNNEQHCLLHVARKAFLKCS